MRLTAFHLLALCSLALFACLTYFVSYSVVMRGVDTIELRHAVEGMRQMQNYMRMIELQMHQRAVDWACWDEAYEYVVNPDEQFIENNMDPDYLRSQNISFVAFFYNEPDPFRFVDNQTVEDETTLLAMRDAAKKVANRLVSLERDSFFGTVNIRGTVFVIGAHRIYDGSQLKPARGMLVMARALDDAFIQEARSMLRQRFAILPKDSFNTPSLESLGVSTFKVLKEKHVFRTYALCNDLFGNASYCIELISDRDISKMGESMSLRNFLLMLGLALLLLCAGLGLLHIKERAIMQRELTYRVGHDSLTGLINKNRVGEELTALLSTAIQHRAIVGALFIDLCRFKNVNDSYGHHVGDRVLQEAANRLHLFAERGFLARTGGDEFLLAIECEDKLELEVLANRIIRTLSAPFLDEGNVIHLGANIGIATSPDDAIDSQILIHRAELAMFAAKEERRDSFRFFDESMGRSASKRMALEAELYSVVEENGLRVFYQPKVDSLQGKVVGLEALVRWQKDDGSWVAPLNFIPLAEETGLVTKIDFFVLRSTCRQVRHWEHEGLAVPVSVNMSARSILSPSFADDVMVIINEEGVNPKRIGVEITETCLVTHLDIASQAIAKLSAEGVEVSLDDFGTGYSSLLYLHSLPISCLKIDKKFIDDINAKEGSSNTLIKSILALAGGLGMHTVAEGVETEEQIRFLNTNACSVIQGYFFSKPLNANDCTSFLTNQRELIAAAHTRS